MNTLAFTVCFAAWMMNGVLITFLVDNGVHAWGPSEMGWLIGIPVLTGAIFRLPLGVATDKWGGRIVYGVLLILAAIPMFLVSYCNTYWQFMLAGLGVRILWHQLCRRHCLHVGVVSQAFAGHGAGDLRRGERRSGVDQPRGAARAELADRQRKKPRGLAKSSQDLFRGPGGHGNCFSC